jgi:hypothetical protein
VNKDRPGGVRRHCPIGGREQYAGRFVIDAPDDNGAVGWRVLEPLQGGDASDSAGPHMDAIRALPDTWTLRDLTVAMHGEDHTKGNYNAVRYQVETLIKAGVVAHVDDPRPGRRTRYRLVETSESTSETDLWEDTSE